MSLSNRFSALLLGTLGLVLIGFSTALFITSRIYLDRQVEDRLSASLHLLTTCVDAKPGWVRWEPRKKRLPPSRWNERRAVTWLVTDGQGRLLTCPDDLPEDELPLSWVSGMGAGTLPDRVTDTKGRSWRVAQTRFRMTGDVQPDVDRPQDTTDGKSYHDEVVLAAFGMLDETEATLASFGWFLLCISVLVWTIAALCARWLLRKTMVPLTRLVRSAQSLDAADPGWTLAEVGTHDELEELRRAFNDLLARLREAYDRQRRFSSEASHQLRTPVAVMIGHLEVVQRYERSGEQYRRVIQLAHKRAVELGQIVESLLFLSRPETSTLTQLELLDLNCWAVKYLENRPGSDRSGDLVLRSGAEGPLWIKAQPHLLGQLVENLLDNACKYSLPGQPIVIETAGENGHALLAVEDSGCGIAREDLTRIFEPFFRSASTSHQRVPGVGLGLSVVERIARAFGGTVTAQSEIGRGSRFEVHLPIAEFPNQESPALSRVRPDLTDAVPSRESVPKVSMHSNNLFY
jgi:signal transduction histidine kinase